MRNIWKIIILMSAGGLVSETVLADYVGYSIGKSDRSPLPERLDGIDAKYLFNVEWGEYDGRKARLGVLEVDNKSTATSYTISSGGMGNIDFSSSSTGVPVNGIEAIVIDSLANTGRFRLVERKVLSNVLDEQDLATSGRIAKPSGPKTGNVLGAQYLVQVVVTDYESNTSGKSGGLGALLTKKVPLIGGVKMKKGQGRIGLNIRLIDAETSEITFTKQIESVVKESGVAFGGIALAGDLGLGGFMSSYAKTPIGQAVIAGINKGVFELIKQVGSQPAEGSVIKADANQIYINIGQDVVSNGDRLQLMAKGEELIDPDTGISLGGGETAIGEIEVTQVQEKFAIAKPVTTSGVPKRGDKVVSTKAPPQLEFASAWNKPK